MVSRCFLGPLPSRSVQRRLHSAWTVRDNDVPTKDQLHERFIGVVSSVYDAVDDDLREVVPTSGTIFSEDWGKSLPMLVDAVLSIVYGQTRFNVLQPSMSSLLMGLSTS